MNAPHRSLLALCANGYWFCEHCERIADNLPDSAEGVQRCAHCHKRHVVWRTPVFNDYEKITAGPLLVGGGAGVPPVR